ncbi:MAG: LacI family DNA-binding transcriptional regulator [Nitriliruptoraceae bacterium]
MAEHLGLSIATVSRAINRRPGVAERTIERVEAAVRELGFSPRLAARQLQGVQSRSISLLFPTDGASVEAYDLDFVLGAATATGERDYFFNLHLEQLGPDDLLRMYRSGLVDGVVLLQVTLEDWRVDLLQEHSLPFTMVGRTRDPEPTTYVDVDFDRAVGIAVDHLASLGHRTVGLLGRPSSQVRAGLGSAVRFETAFLAACDASDVVPLLVPSGLDRTSAAQALQRLHANDPAPTALITTHGQGTAAALRWARERGLGIPTDLSLIAIGTDRLLDLLDPVPSMVAFPASDLGYRAAAMLIERIEDGRSSGPLPPEHLLLPVELTLRGTTAPPAARST